MANAFSDNKVMYNFNAKFDPKKIASLDIHLLDDIFLRILCSQLMLFE
jgi:hypothetical protein